MSDANDHHGNGTPPAEVEIDEALVRSLLEEEQPELAGLPLTHVESGWDNATWRLGEELAVRVPRRAIGDLLLRREQAWLPVLAPGLPLPVPAPLHPGEPTERYPWAWSVVPWLPGEAVDRSPLRADQAEVLGGFLRALHRPAPEGAPTSEVRGVPLSARVEGVRERMERLARTTDAITPRIRSAWEEAQEAPLDRSPTWLHGDLHARNVLAREGAITGVIDWGDLCAGDPACDLDALWMLLPDAAARRAAREAYGEVSEATWARARGWAILIGVVLLDTGLQDTPRHARMGAEVLRRAG
ncbi:MAG: aminoglycoside phosphotransferase family protein [Deltaproteobacteria bacterium]|nr:aminoglycoside phosphotransferase family protein [Deltaproteobacteria bacterium]